MSSYRDWRQGLNRTVIFDLLSSISDSAQEEFDELISGDSNKDRFLRALLRIFAPLLSTKVDTAEKAKNFLKIAIETTIKIWQEPKPQRKDYLPRHADYLSG